MLVLAHVLIAIASLGYTTYLFFAPTRAKLRLSCALVAVTLISGTYLVYIAGAHILPACTTGLIYLGVVSLGIVSARNKLAKI